MLRSYQKKCAAGLLALLLGGLQTPESYAVVASPEVQISVWEERLYGLSYDEEEISARLERLELQVFGESSATLKTADRLNRLNEALQVPKQSKPSDFAEAPPTKQAASGGQAKNTSTTTQVILQKNIDSLSDKMFKVINEERSLRRLQPLERDSIADNMALKQASYLVQTGQFSHYGPRGLDPDERYTLEGGSDRVVEVIDGFFAPLDSEQKRGRIVVSEELANQLMDAIGESPDKSSVLFDAEANRIGISFVLSSDGSQLAVVIEAVADHATLSEIPQRSEPANLSIGGSLNDGFKLSWVGVSHKPLDRTERSELEASPFFSPIDKVIYMDRSRSRAKALATTGGMIAAMIAAPFTYGASVLVADILMQQLAETYQLQDVQVRDGISTYGGASSFSGGLVVGEWGPGIYYVTVWGTRDKSQKPVVLSRRTVEVY